MKMNPEIRSIAAKRLVGMQLETSFAADRTFDLWRRFMPRQREIENRTGGDLYSVEVYPENFFENFDAGRAYEKWAAVEVARFDAIPAGFDGLEIAEGLYAVFLYRGNEREAAGFYQSIFGNWLPASEFSLDARPHFALMGEKYKTDAADSEEEIYIPVKEKAETLTAKL